MGELMSFFEPDDHSHNFLSPRDIVICGVEKNLDLPDYDQLLIVLVDDGRLLIVVAWICRSELRPSNKNCWIYL
jgi:hypothetical protein